MSRGPASSGFNPSKEKYRCPVQNCNSDLNKSAAIETIEKRIEKKSRFSTSFWQDTSK